MDPFTSWLQARLRAHGGSLDVDGDLGRSTIRAINTFQLRAGLSLTGLADAPTVAALRLNPSDASRAPSDPPAELMPVWMAEMNRRSGLHEVRDNSVIADWLRSAGRFLGNPRDLPWCGDAVETCIAKTLPTEPLPGNPFFAQAWAKFGVDAGGPLVGSIGVIKWTATSGHVGMVARATADTVHMLGGNQSNAINVSSFPRSKFIAFRWPRTVPTTRYAQLPVTGKALDAATTR